MHRKRVLNSMTKKMNKIEKIINQLCPEGVEFRALGEVVNILDNQRKPITRSKREKGNIPYYGANGIQDYVKGYIFDGTFLLMGEDGSVINKDSSPVLNWAIGKIWVNNHAHVLGEIKEVALLRFVYFYLQIIDVTSIVRGVPPKINQRNLRTIPLPIPPLAVQEEIVKILDNFTKLEAELEAELEARKKQYEHYREELLSFGDSVKIKKINEVSAVFDSLHQTPKYSDDGFPMIRVTDIKGGYVNIENTLKVDKDIFEIFTKKYKPQFNDIVISRVGSYGNFSLIGEENQVCLGQNTAIIHPQINAKYLFYALYSKEVARFVEDNVGGGSQKTITLAKIKEIPIPIPPLTEQKRIVAILDKFDALVNDISTGLPAEIAARKKQYEYYRNQLLTFKPLEKQDVN